MIDHDFIRNLSRAFGFDHKLAARELGVSLKTYHRYRERGDAPTPVKKLASIIARGYLPDSGPWKDCYIDTEGFICTTFGKVSCGQLSFYHRKAWAAEHYSREFKKIKNSPTDDAILEQAQDKLLDIIMMLSSKTGT